MQDYFTKGLQSKINMGGWAKMPIVQDMQPPIQTNPALPPIPAPGGGGIGSVADYNTMTPLAGGTPAGAVPATGAVAGATARANRGGFLGAIMRQFLDKGYIQ